MNHEPWLSIFKEFSIDKHDFSAAPYEIGAEQIKFATRAFQKTGEREVRVLCKQDRREDRPRVFVERNLFILPINNGRYVILEGEGYTDIPEISGPAELYKSALDFELKSSAVGNSEMQHLDFAYASSLIRHFMQDDSLVLTIRGRKYTPEFRFVAGKHRHTLTAKSVQTEVDAGYEGRNQIVLVEAKNLHSRNVVIRQLYYPFRQWSENVNKPVKVVFFERRDDEFALWEFDFKDSMDYNGIFLVRSGKYRMVGHKN